MKQTIVEKIISNHCDHPVSAGEMVIPFIDLAAVMATGKLWLKVPVSIKIELKGRLGKTVSAKDLALFMAGKLGNEAANSKCLEFCGEAFSTLDLDILKNYIMEDIEPEFAGKVRPGDILAAGYNFGCGSAMEVASLVIKAAGIKVIIAKSFARTFYRNAINGGLLPIETDTDGIDAEDRLRIELGNSDITIHNLTKNTVTTAIATGAVILEIFKAGGLVNYIRDAGNFPRHVSEK